MITEKFDAALNDLGSLAGTVPSDVWERLSPIHAQLRGIQEPLAEMERLGIAPGQDLSGSRPRQIICDEVD
ncbi:hypothetical protein [Desulfocurvibacter africanus]|uniref:Uncharacterized protein n=1 Tax=Desulfocurvibacter africanus subsp. africanus str. Walvis Bay TaxID=690850 RepID=F3YVZ0_DESAF|nr:hypothetical protein [Desulfocurvibacter africanus]EGJ49020.1 hypothetical protein Desaf_0668 [Desulfocurvibacter africanus subsp. africanus str. Walvis Bay]